MGKMWGVILKYINIDLSSNHMQIIIDSLEWIRKRKFNKISERELRTVHTNATCTLNRINGGCYQMTPVNIRVITNALFNLNIIFKSDPDNFDISDYGPDITPCDYMSRIQDAIHWLNSCALASGFEVEKRYL
jgi:hypothetical protein